PLEEVEQAALEPGQVADRPVELLRGDVVGVQILRLSGGVSRWYRPRRGVHEGASPGSFPVTHPDWEAARLRPQLPCAPTPGPPGRGAEARAPGLGPRPLPGSDSGPVPPP